EVNLHAIKVAPLGRAFAAKLLPLRQATTLDANVVADFDGEAVEQVLRRGVGLFKEPAELMKEADGQLRDLMQPSAQTRFAQHPRHQARLLEKRASQFKIAAEVKNA